ncbi:MAG: hypothetical protein ACYDEF_12585 [Methanosarcina sp.]
MPLYPQRFYFSGRGLEAKKNEVIILWGVLGQALLGSKISDKIKGLDKFKEMYPEGIIGNG